MIRLIPFIIGLRGEGQRNSSNTKSRHYAYADASLEKVKEAKLRYLYIVKKYNYDNFMGFELPKSNAKSILPDWMGEKSSGEQTGAVLIVTLAALSLGLVVTLTCKKKRQ